MSLAKIWKRRIEAGTQRLDKCPNNIVDEVISLIREDIQKSEYTTEELHSLVDDGKLSEDDYNYIIEGVVIA